MSRWNFKVLGSEYHLAKHRDEIITLYRDRRYTKERIRRTLEDKHGIEIPKSTFGRFVNAMPELKEAPESLPPEAEHFLEQYETYQSLAEGIKAVTDVAANVHGRMGVLEDAAAERHQQTMDGLLKLVRELEGALDKRHDAIVNALKEIYNRIPTREDLENALNASMQGVENQDPRLNAIQEALRKQASDITAIRRSVGPVWSMVRKNAPWMKAALFTGLFWLAVIVGAMWYYKLGKYLPWKLPLIS